ncbi:MAG: LCP family protein [Patescibacteria group bacterium]|nr:LCP family protein [Patescibacteria group bacterium]
MIDFKKKMEEELRNRLEYQRPPKRKLGLKIGGFLIAFLILFFATVLISGDASESWAGRVPILGKLIVLVESSDKKLKGESNDRINILLLGMGGKKHDGGYLTDTIVLVSLKPSTKQVAMLSIPRDMMIAVEGMGWQKINTINALAERKKDGKGGEAVSQAVSDIFGVPIHYYFRIDFEGFINIINHLGGVEVYVDNTLSDFRYPIAGREDYDDYYARFEHLYIEKGWQKMDGELALKYARSRHALGLEGSDFARAKRQQKIIQAVKDKVLSAENLLKPAMINSVISELNEHLLFNLKIWEVLKMWQMFKDVKSEDISNNVLDDGPGGLLVSGRSEAGAYILTPRSGNFDDIKYLVNNFFPESQGKKAESNSQEKATVISENNQSAKIEIKNGTWINGLANQTAIDLDKHNFEILRISNSSQRDFKDSVIYDLSYGSKKEALKYLKDFLKADVFLDLPDWLAEEIKLEAGFEKKEVPDFLIILGESASKNNF